MTFYELMNEWLTLSTSQTNLVMISMVTTIIQLLIFLFIMKQGTVNVTTFAYIFIVFVYNVLYYKLFIKD